MQGEFISKLIFKVLDANFYPGTHLIKFHIWKGKRQITNKQTNKQKPYLVGTEEYSPILESGSKKAIPQYHLCVSVHSINSEQCFSRWRSQYQTPKSEYTQHTECSILMNVHQHTK